jgi:hypothetical protein
LIEICGLKLLWRNNISIIIMINVHVVMPLFTLYRNKRGHVVKPAPFQGSATAGEVARIEPNRKWFGMSCLYSMCYLQAVK